MLPNANHPELGRFLGIGNIVTAGIYLYRSRFKQYLKLAIVAHLWLLLPIYGWAKYSAISASIARMAFGDLAESSVEAKVTQQQIDRHKWQLLTINILVTLVNLLVVIIAFWGLVIIFAILSLYIPELGELIKNQTDTPSISALFLGGGLILVIGLSSLWIYTRFFVVELPCTLESNFRIYKTIQRSRRLSKKSNLFILFTILLLLLISCPISYIAVQFGTRIIMAFLKSLPIYPYPNWSLRFLIYYTVLTTLSLLTNMVTMPLWQTTKAALYYSLRSRREGFDLQLRNADSAID